MGRELQACGVGHGEFVTVAMPNSIEWFIAYVACWNIGAIPQPVSARLPGRELAGILGLAASKVVVIAFLGGGRGIEIVAAARRLTTRSNVTIGV